MNKRIITLKQLALECNVSVATASKALNHAQDVSQETAERVRAKARELGYTPNAAARSLKTNKTYNIGVLFEDDTHVGLTHEYFVSVLNALKDEVESHGYDITFISRKIGMQHMSFREHSLYRRCEGVVIANVDFNTPEVRDLIDSDIPVVTLDYVFDDHSAVLSDNARGMRDLVEYVYSQGHRKIAFIHGEKTAVTKARVDSFFRTCEQLNVTVPKEYVRSAKFHDLDCSAQATRDILKLEDRPTCILYPDDISALGGIRELEKEGLRIGDDISIAGYDGIELSQLLRPALTTLHQDSVVLGSKAAQLLINEIEHPENRTRELHYVAGTLLPGGTVRKL